MPAGGARSDLMNAVAIALHSESLNDSPQMNYRLYSDPFLIHFATVIKHNNLIHLCAFYIILLISIAVAALASFFPVKKTASKKPIDAIRGR